jgi:hypothetical protein
MDDATRVVARVVVALDQSSVVNSPVGHRLEALLRVVRARRLDRAADDQPRDLLAGAVADARDELAGCRRDLGDPASRVERAADALASWIVQCDRLAGCVVGRADGTRSLLLRQDARE